jgi:O-antigen ligase
VNQLKLIQPQLHFWLCCLISFFLPLGFLVPVFIIIQLANWLLEGRLRQKFSTAPKFPLLIFVGLYVLYMAGMLFTQNTDAGWFDLQVKLSLLIFPVVLLTGAINNKQYSAILLSFIAGNALAAMVCLAGAIVDYILNNQAHFFYGTFSLFLHPGYFAMYIDFCILILLLSFITDQYTLAISTSAKITFIVFFSCIVFLLSSKAGLIVLTLIYLMALVAFVIRSGKYIVGIASLLIAGIGIYMLIKNVPEVGGRFKNVVNVYNEEKVDKTSAESNSIRILVWQKDIKLIKENLLTGVGTGDVKDELVEKYKADGITGAYSIDPLTNKVTKALNAHSQFFQTFIAIGIVGFIFFIAGFICPTINSVRKGNYLYMGFLLIIVLNFATESMLETQAGVMFYAFFNALLYKSGESSVLNS